MKRNGMFYFKSIIMKKVIFSTIFLGIILTASGQDYKTSLGIRAGLPYGLTIKHFLDKKNAVEYDSHILIINEVFCLEVYLGGILMTNEIRQPKAPPDTFIVPGGADLLYASFECGLTMYLANISDITNLNSVFQPGVKSSV